MEHRTFKEFKISRLGIGTVQFGCDYGINNETGQVLHGDVIKIFDSALEHGVNHIDTSAGYGLTEEIIGNALNDLNAVEEFTVCSQPSVPLGDPEIMIPAARKSLYKSLEELRIDSMPFYIMHPEYRTINEGDMWEFLKAEVKKGTIKHLGLSIIRGPYEALEAIEDPAVEVFQIPYNVFDQRWKRVLIQAADRGKIVFNRSSYLQGLLLMDLNKVSEKMPEAFQYKKDLNRIAGERGRDLKEMVLEYVLSEKRIISSVIGVDSHEQFLKNIDIYDALSIDEKTIEMIQGWFKYVPDEIVNPALWKINEG